MAMILVHRGGGRKYSGVSVPDKSGTDEVVNRSASGMVEDGEGATEVTSSVGSPDDVDMFENVDGTFEEVVPVSFDGDNDATTEVTDTAATTDELCKSGMSRDAASRPVTSSIFACVTGDIS